MAKLTEKQRQAIFALLAVLSVAAVAYAFLSQSDGEAQDGKQFVQAFVKAPKAGILYDVRGAGPSLSQAIYQCGVNIISNGVFAGKELQIIACGDNGCLSVSSATNASSTMAYNDAAGAISASPYVLINGGKESGLHYFQRHLEITIGENVTSDRANCNIEAGA